MDKEKGELSLGFCGRSNRYLNQLRVHQDVIRDYSLIELK
jgi:hypothetical protein